MPVLDHIENPQIFERDPIVPLNQAVDDLVQVVFATIGNTHMLALELRDRLATVRATLLPTRDTPLQDPQTYLVVWPPGVQLRRTGDRLALVNDAEQVLAEVGETIRMSGGALPTAAEVAARQPLSQPVPPRCPGPYWVVGEELGRSTE